ncbi:MAG TPA: FlgD immunoglobulin-like domain containing protein, partial [Gemmatimonadales bacterium]|nr:FlgD immunoglobulin-like domain containing protein [Gemmatimonadales bacterium]
ARNALGQNAPNPFNPSTVIRYSVAQTGPVTLRIFNAGGALVRTLVDTQHAPGDYSVRWDGHDDSGRRLSSGVYFYKIETAAGFRDSKKLILLK